MPRLAVLPFDIPQGVNQNDAEVLAQLLATEIANSGKYVVLPRTNTIERVMEEHRIQRSGLTDPESIRRLGNAVNAQYVLAGNVMSLGANMNLFFAQILHVECGSLLIGGDEEYRTRGWIEAYANAGKQPDCRPSNLLCWRSWSSWWLYIL